MITLQLITWFILSYGLMNIMVYGSIFQGLRNFFKRWGDSNMFLSFFPRFIDGILSCPMCFATWGGFFLSLVVFSPTYMIFGLPIWGSWFYDGILSSGAVWAINAIVEYYEENRPQK
jgi:hypothetical protein